MIRSAYLLFSPSGRRVNVAALRPSRALPLFACTHRCFYDAPDGLPDAKLVKAFNSVSSNRMVDPQFAGGRPTMFICGNDEGAKRTVAGLLDQFGWETADMGRIEAARAIEPLCMLWCIPGFVRNEWMHAFKLLK